MRFSLLALALLLVACQPEADAPGSEAPAESAEIVATEATPGDIVPGVAAPNFKLASTSGEPYQLGDLQGRTVVLEWLNYDCPYVGKHYGSGNMQALQQGYTDPDADDVVWLSIVSSAPGEQGYFEPDEMDARTEQEKGMQTAVLLDPTGEVGRLYGAKTTPHMFVISPEGTVVYNGAIDDRPSSDLESLDGATNYLVSAMDALEEGRDADPDRTVPYGCSVKYVDA